MQSDAGSGSAGIRLAGKTPAEKSRMLVEIINRTKIDSSYKHRYDDLIGEKIGYLAAHCAQVLDFGKSSRGHFSKFKQGQVKTCDINRFEGYPDVVDDICDVTVLPKGVFDGIVCMAVLEHVYEPQRAVDNLLELLQAGGYCLAYTPFLYRYHAPSDLKYQDFFRFTKDGLAYLFRNFEDVTLYPVRGRFSTIGNLLPGWKSIVERYAGQRINRLIDGLLSFKGDDRQVSGYYIWAKKASSAT